MTLGLTDERPSDLMTDTVSLANISADDDKPSFKAELSFDYSPKAKIGALHFKTKIEDGPSNNWENGNFFVTVFQRYVVVKAENQRSGVGSEWRESNATDRVLDDYEGVKNTWAFGFMVSTKKGED
jgi:hypothetical protein